MKSIFEKLKEQQNSPTYPLKQRINELKRKLSATDYQAIKYAEGLISEDEYYPMKAQRMKWRAEINALEEDVKLLEEPLIITSSLNR